MFVSSKSPLTFSKEYYYLLYVCLFQRPPDFLQRILLSSICLSLPKAPWLSLKNINLLYVCLFQRPPDFLQRILLSFICLSLPKAPWLTPKNIIIFYMSVSSKGPLTFSKEYYYLLYVCLFQRLPDFLQRILLSSICLSLPKPPDFLQRILIFYMSVSSKGPLTFYKEYYCLQRFLEC